MTLSEETNQVFAATREDAINEVISSIAMEELGLSHIINAEGEKLQYVLGTLSGSTGPGATVSEVLSVNESIRSVLRAAADSQMLLRDKLQIALSSAVLTGPTGPTGPPPEVEGLQVELRDAQSQTIDDNAAVIFDTPVSRAGTTIAYDTETGEFTLSQPGSYLVHWWVSVDGASSTTGMSFSLFVDGTAHSTGVSPLVTGHVSGSALIVVTAPNASMYLRNVSEESISLEDYHTQAGITIMSVPTAST